MPNLSGKYVAILVTNGFEQEELTEPKKALEQAGAKTAIVSPEKGKVKGWKHKDWGDEFTVDVALNDAKPADFDALLLPGGVLNPDQLRSNGRAIDFIKQFYADGKPIAAICHGPWLLIDAGIAQHHTLTSWPSIKIDLMNAGATWIDNKVVIDKNIVTSRKPEDLPAFNQGMIQLFAEAPTKEHLT